MLNSAWDWLVSLVAVSHDGTPMINDALKPRGPPSDALWLDNDWDGRDERAMVECILSEDDEKGASCLQGLLCPSGDDTKHSLEAARKPPQCKKQATCGRNRAATWKSCKVSPAESQESRSCQATNSPSSESEIPPLELETAPDSTPPRTSTRPSPSDAVCQTSKDEDPWSSAYATRPSVGSSPKSVFDTFLEDHLLPPQLPRDEGKRTLVLDLDETLVHSLFQPTPAANFQLKVFLEQGPLDVFVLKRPGVDAFLKAMAAHFEVVVFTASVKEYADPLLDILDPEGLVSHRLFRDACTNAKNGYVKDLTRLGRKLSETIIVDNSPHAYAFQPDNALPILSFYDDPTDSELKKVTPFLESLGSLSGDVRNLLSAALGANVKSLLHSRLALLL